MTEQQWIARARHGDADAFEQLVVAYEGPVYRLALRDVRQRRRRP